MNIVITDGGRQAAGFPRNSRKGDCVVRAIAIAAERPYGLVRDELNDRACRLTDVVDGPVPREVYEPYLLELGWRWKPTMLIGSGCRVHLRAAELPMGRLIVRVSVHLVAVLDGVVHDLYDPTRNGGRCVYGYYHR